MEWLLYLVPIDFTLAQIVNTITGIHSFFVYQVKDNNILGEHYPKVNHDNSPKFSWCSYDARMGKQCQKHKLGVPIDFSDLDEADYISGEIIGGGLVIFGWVVIKGVFTLDDHPSLKE